MGSWGLEGLEGFEGLEGLGFVGRAGCRVLGELRSLPSQVLYCRGFAKVCEFELSQLQFSILVEKALLETVNLSPF